MSSSEELSAVKFRRIEFLIDLPNLSRGDVWMKHYICSPRSPKHRIVQSNNACIVLYCVIGYLLCTYGRRKEPVAKAWGLLCCMIKTINSIWLLWQLSVSFFLPQVLFQTNLCCECTVPEHVGGHITVFLFFLDRYFSFASALLSLSLSKLCNGSGTCAVSSSFNMFKSSRCGD